MRTPLILFALAAVSVSAGAAVEIGATREAVVQELGQPTGSAAIGGRTILFFPRGEVQFAQDRVVGLNLVSEEEFMRRAAEEEAARESRATLAAARLEQLEAEGRALHAAKKSDPAFAALPAEDQLRYWLRFGARYPMISVRDEIQPLRELVESEHRLREIEAQENARLAELEARVENAEARAARAEREARRDRYIGYPGYPGIRPPRPGPKPPTPRASPPQNPIDADRARAMAEYEEARRQAYNGGVSEPETPPVRGQTRDH